MCFEKVEPKISSGVTTLLFPSIVQQKLDEATNTEHWILDKLYKYRVVRYACRVTYLPTIAAIEYALFGLKSAATWIASLPYLNAAASRFREMILFITNELQRIYGSIIGISCLIPVPSVSSRLSSNLPQSKQDYENSLPLADVNIVSSRGNLNFTYDDDSLGQVVDYCKQHDAILAYYYRDDNNMTQVCEIFDMNNPRHISTCHSTISRRTMDLPPLIQEQEDENVDHLVGNYSNARNAEDSGLSLTEDNAVTFAVNKRDACCSPVRKLALNKSMRGNTSRRSIGHRRSGAKISNTIPDSSCSMENDLKGSDPVPIQGLSNNNIFSSDSDPDAGGEMLFISNRRKRTATNDYDGDPEQSDTDRGC